MKFVVFSNMSLCYYFLFRKNADTVYRTGHFLQQVYLLYALQSRVYNYAIFFFCDLKVTYTACQPPNNQ